MLYGTRLPEALCGHQIRRSCQLDLIASVRTFRLKLGSEDAYLGAPPLGVEPGHYFLRPPWLSLYSDRYETLLVRIESCHGHVGWGEALTPVGPEVAQAAVDHLLAPQLIGASSVHPRPVSTGLGALMRERGHLVGHQADALAACDLALWDLAGSVTGLSVAQLLGGAYRTAIPTYVSGLPRSTDVERADLAAEWVSKGVRRIKLALGYGVKEDLATYDSVSAVHPDLVVAVDAHWAYTQSDAERLGQGLDERNAWFLEAPMVPEDVEGHRQLASRLTTPVAVGETLRNRYEFAHWLARRAVDLCQPDVARTGITESMAIATLAQAHHARVALHHSVGLGVALAAGLHVAAAVENLEAFEYQPATLYHANEILSTPLAVEPAAIELPKGAGLGVTVDEAAVRELERRSR